MVEVKVVVLHNPHHEFGGAEAREVGQHERNPLVVRAVFDTLNLLEQLRPVDSHDVRFSSSIR